MGRGKIKIARLPTEGQRKITYGKRRKGILKKAFEISTLCDIQAVLIMFSPSGKLDYFSTKPGIWDILKRFVCKDHITSRIDNESLEESKDVIDSIDYFSAQYEAANNSGDMVHDEIEVMLLELQKKMVHPDSEAFDSTQEFENLIHGLENVRRIIANTRNAGRQILMEQPQARIEDGMWGPLQGEESMQQHVGGMFGMSTAPGGAPWQLPMPQQGVPAIGGQQNIHTPASLFEQFHTEPFREQYRTSVACGSMPQHQGVAAIGSPTTLCEQMKSEPFMDQYRVSDDDLIYAAPRLENFRNNCDGPN